MKFLFFKEFPIMFCFLFAFVLVYYDLFVVSLGIARGTGQTTGDLLVESLQATENKTESTDTTRPEPLFFPMYVEGRGWLK